MNGPILKGSKIILKPMSIKENAPLFVKWFKDKEVIKYLSANFKGLTVAKEVKFLQGNIEDKNKIFWIICDQNGKVIGNTELRLDKDNKKANWGIVIGEKKYWNKGLGQDTLRIVIKYCFNTLKFNRFELMVYDGNIKALKCYTKCGLRLEGTKRQCLYRNGKYMDGIIMSMLKSEYKKIPPEADQPVAEKSNNYKLKK